MLKVIIHDAVEVDALAKQIKDELWHNARPLEVAVRKKMRHRTHPQLNLLWHWHHEVASELSVRTGRPWSAEDVHELVFLPRFMPCRECSLPNGETVMKAMRTSVATAKIVADAMEAYQAWCADMLIETTYLDQGA
jgi:hypothetical protein